MTGRPDDLTREARRSHVSWTGGQLATSALKPHGYGDFAALVTRALQEFDLRFSIPWGTARVFAVAVIVGILAAIMPARRAAS